MSPMFFSIFIFSILLITNAIDGSFIQPRKISDENLPDEGNANEKFAHILEARNFLLENFLEMNSTFLANLSKKNDRNGHAKRQAQIETEALRGEKIDVQTQHDLEKIRTMQKWIDEHNDMYGKCSAIWNEVEKFLKKGIQAKKDGFFSFLLFRIKNSLFSNKLGEFVESIKEADKICHLSMLSLLEAGKIDPHSELINLAMTKVRNDLDRFKTVLNTFKKIMGDE